jgi:PAS domain S-box-containing protein
MTSERVPQFDPQPDATGAAAPLPSPGPGVLSREAYERQAAFTRARARAGEPAYTLCAPELPGLRSDLLFTLHSENVRDYAIFLMDANGIIQCWGESARLLKWWTRQQAEGAHLRLLYPDNGSEDGTAEDHLQNASDSGEYTGEGHRVRSDGTLFWAYVTLTALRNNEGELVGFTKVTRDFSARRAVEATLRRESGTSADARAATEEATRLKRLLASVSHELRNPLNAMLGSVALLEREIPTGAAGRSSVERLQRSGTHLLQILDDVLEMSRAEAGQLPISRQVRRLGPAIQEALADVESLAGTRGVTIADAVSGTAADLPYWGDEGRVRQILVNLLSNAVKFTDPGGIITISGGTGESVKGAMLAGAGPWSYVRVEDTGRGIPATNLERIFEPYQQSQAGDQHQGTGLGLSISRQLARLMGGDLTADSQVGTGSVFTLWLPIAPSDPVPR